MPNSRRPQLVTDFAAHRVSTLELFFDLVFVYAITQTTQLMADHPTPLGVGQGVVLIAVLWWCWCSYAWLANSVHLDRGPVKLAAFGAMAMMFLVSLTIPEAFTDFDGGLHAPSLFVGTYLVVRLLHVAAYLSASREDPRLRRVLFSVLPGMLAGVAILFVAGFTSGALQLGLWVLALAVDYLNVYLTSSGWRLNAPAHFAERFGLIVIIALGESIVAIGAGIATLPMTWLVAVTATLGLALATAMWWLYFDVVARFAEHRLAEAADQERTRLATDSYTYLHLPMIVGIVLTALGLKKALLYVADTAHHTPGEALHGVAIWALTGGVALYLVALSGLRKRNLGSWNHQRLVLAAVLLAATPALELVPATVLVAVVAVALVGLITFERVHHAELRRKLQRQPE